jgi:hypothetical protein
MNGPQIFSLILTSLPLFCRALAGCPSSEDQHASSPITDAKRVVVTTE